jgi:50S ribosomal protein L16 3-hydroxylase
MLWQLLRNPAVIHIDWTRMSLSDLFAPLSSQQFVEDYLFRLPYSTTGSCRSWCDFGWDAVGQVWSAPGADSMIVRHGEQLALEKEGFAAARKKFDEGFTLAVRSAQKHDRRLALLAGDFESGFAAPVDVHIYCTPESQFGFSWHYDAEEVFILQLSGSKEYSLRKNTVRPWPLVETMGADLGYEKEIMPLMKCRLDAGDLLYIPAGYWHRAESVGESISLSVGVMAPPALDLFDALRTRLMRSVVWRQRLPVLGSAGGLSAETAQAAYECIIRNLAVDLQREFTSPGFMADVLASHSSAPGPTPRPVVQGT